MSRADLLGMARAQVKELEAQLSKADEAALELAVSRQDAETALASAREIAQHMRECAGHAIAAFGPQKRMTVPYHGDFAGANPTVAKQILRFVESLSAALTSHPAPVANHCQECVELGACPAEAERLFEESGDDEPEEDTESLIEQLDEALCARCGELRAEVETLSRGFNDMNAGCLRYEQAIDAAVAELEPWVNVRGSKRSSIYSALSALRAARKGGGA